MVLCIASIRDQVEEGIGVEHYVQDGGSADDTLSFLSEFLADSQDRKAYGYTLSYESAPDNGMYDGINKGIASVSTGQRALGLGEMSSGAGRRFGVDGCFRLDVDGLNRDEQTPGTPNSKLQTSNRDDSIVAWLNCDEQYLPGTLKKVSDFFLANPSIDILFGGMLMVDADGKLLACRKAMPMRRLFLEASYLYNFSCAMFFRRSAWERLGGFDTSFKNAGDEELIRRALKLGLKTAVLKDYLSVFTYSQMNLSSGGSALEEHEKLKKTGSWMSRSFRLPINLFRLTEKALRGGLVQRGPVEYDIYTDDLTARTHFKVQKPSCRWPDNNQPYLFKHRLDGR